MVCPLGGLMVCPLGGCVDSREVPVFGLIC